MPHQSISVPAFFTTQAMLILVLAVALSVCLCLSVCVCLSITSQSSTKMATFWQATPCVIPGTPFFWCQTLEEMLYQMVTLPMTLDDL